MYFSHQIIKSDLFDIAKRLKEIDKGYFVAFNHKKKRFEVHNKLQRGSSLCLIVPFDRLDKRTIDLVRKTRSERIESLLAEAQKDNQMLAKKAIDNAKKSAEYKIEAMIG